MSMADDVDSLSALVMGVHDAQNVDVMGDKSYRPNGEGLVGLVCVLGLKNNLECSGIRQSADYIGLINNN